VNESWRRARASDAWAATWLLTELTPTLAQRTPQLLARLVLEHDQAEAQAVLVDGDRVPPVVPP